MSHRRLQKSRLRKNSTLDYVKRLRDRRNEQARQMEQQYDESFEITTIVNVERFFRHVIGILGKGFHPDTDFNDYVESTREVNEFDDHSEVTSTFTQEVGD